MADVIGSAAKGWRLYVNTPSGRQGLRLERQTERNARRVADHVIALATAARNGVAPDTAHADWLGTIAPGLRGKLVRMGLAQPKPDAKPAPVAKLAAFVDGYIAQRPDLKAGTLAVLHQARRHLCRFLGDDKALADVTPGDADNYRADLLGRGIAKATVAKWCQYARHFMAVAQRRKLIAENPFAHIKAAVRGNPARRVFVSAADVRKVIDAATDPQWRLLIALGRWGGLRIPSEALALTWADVDLENGRFTVRASKTEHHEGGGVRVVPIFPELRPFFEAVFSSDAAEGAVHVITRYRDPAANLRTQLCRYITAAGLKPWPKPWQNLRASRATDLADEYPSHVCAAWLGHSEAVADAFYRTVTDDHFARATAADPDAGIKSGAPSGAQSPVTVLQALEPGSSDPSKMRQNQARADGCKSMQSAGLGAAGTEQPPKNTANPHGAGESGAPGGALATRGGDVDPDLAAVIDAWPRMPWADRLRVLAIARGVAVTAPCGVPTRRE